MSKVLKLRVPLTFINHSEAATFISVLELVGIFLGSERLLELADVWTHGPRALYKISCQSDAS